MIVEPVTLEGKHVRLELLSLAHHAELCEAGLDEDLWRWIAAPVRTPEEMRAYIETALSEQAAGAALPFATIERASGRAIGSTRYGNIDRSNRRVEIGWTWIARPWQRTAVNTEAKYLMLRHAFETLRCIAVDLRTHERNTQSRTAIERLGAKLDGILRNHRILPDGSLRNTASYSIIATEWPDVKARLEAHMSAPRC